MTGWDRLAQVEGTLASLTEQVEQLGAMVRELTEAVEAGKAARLQATPSSRPAVSVADATPEVMREPQREVQRVAPAVVQTMQGVPEPQAPAPADVKVSFFADGGTKAVVGQAKVIQQ